MPREKHGCDVLEPPQISMDIRRVDGGRVGKGRRSIEDDGTLGSARERAELREAHTRERGSNQREWLTPSHGGVRHIDTAQHVTRDERKLSELQTLGRQLIEDGLCADRTVRLGAEG